MGITMLKQEKARPLSEISLYQMSERFQTMNTLLIRVFPTWWYLSIMTSVQLMMPINTGKN